MFRNVFLAVAASTLLAGPAVAPAFAKDLKSIGITLGSLGNPYFVALTKGATEEAHTLDPRVRITSVSADYDLNKQFTQIDNFIASGVDLILLNSVDPRAITPAVKRAQAAGIVVVAVDVAADGADATVQTNNVQAGEMACQYLADKIGHKGNVIIENGPQVSSVTDRVKGCKSVLGKDQGIKLLSDDQDGKGSREGGMNAMEGYLTRFPSIQGLFAINDPQAIGSDLAAQQLHRSDMVITSVDGAPDIVSALKGKTLVQASASQDPATMGRLAVRVGNDLLHGKKPADPMLLMAPTLVTRDNVGQYKGW